MQRRVLTSFQARSIEAIDHDRLKIGPSNVLDLIGHGPDSETFLTCLPGERSTCIVKRVRIPSELRTATVKRLQRLIERGHGCQHPGVVIPHTCRELPADASRSESRRTGLNAQMGTQTRLAIVSRPAEGLTLGQMLLRRGRFPERTVLEIARQLLDVVGALHDCRIVHGEIRPGNLLLSAGGQLVLVDSGIRLAICPTFEISAFVEPERNDGIAPELIGTGDQPSVAADLYAIGCVLWQLLAGRPPYPTGDPLAKLAAHQTERIPDVRELAPETPTRLAEAINCLTEPDPARRPAHVREVLAGPATPSTGISRPALGQPGRRARKVLAGFAGQFHHPVARSSAPTQRPRTTSRLALASAAVLLALASLHLFAGRETLPASIDRFGEWFENQYAAIASSSGSVDANAAHRGDDPETGDTPQAATSPIPEPNAEGTIDFPHAGPWDASSIVWSGARLTLRGPPGTPAQIMVRDEPLQLRAIELCLENVEILIHTLRLVPPTSALVEPDPAVICESQTLRVTGCKIHGTRLASNAPIDAVEPLATQEFKHPVGLRWQALDPNDPLAGRISFDDCQLIGTKSSIELSSPAREIGCTNTLKLTGGPLFVIGPDTEPVSRSFQLDRITVRNSRGLISVRLPKGHVAWQSRLTVRCNDCVFSLFRFEPMWASLITFVGEQLPNDWHRYVVIDGRDSVADRTFSRLASLRSRDGQQDELLDDSRLQIRGLISTDITYQGDVSRKLTDSVVATVAANRRSSALPGIVADEQDE